MPQSLKIANKNNRISYDLLWIAGMDTTINEENTTNKQKKTETQQKMMAIKPET